MRRRREGRHWLWCAVLPLLVALVMPLAVAPATAQPVAVTAAGAHGFGQVRLDDVRPGSLPGHQTWTVSWRSTVPLGAGPDAVCPVVTPWAAPDGRGRAHSTGAVPHQAQTVPARHGRSPPS